MDPRLSAGDLALAGLAARELLPPDGATEPNYKGYAEPVDVPAAKAGRNAACPCGSGKKHKKCCRTAHRAVWPTPPESEEEAKPQLDQSEKVR